MIFRRYTLDRFTLMAVAVAMAAVPGSVSAQSAPPASEQGGGPKPNILFVFADQLRYRALGIDGNKVVKTPNLDRLGRQGLVFDQAFSCDPICSPYRAQLVTGKYGFANGVVDNEYKLKDGQITLPIALKTAGYQTAYVGKWHLGEGPYTPDKRYGFDYMAAYNCEHAYYKTQYYENERGPIKFGVWAPEGETELAIRFMEKHQRENPNTPFALLMSWAPPHWPYDQYPDKYKIYDPAKVDLLPNVPVQMAAFARKEIANYYGNITGLDEQMGKLLETLDRLGIADNTIVCFSSDHGDHLSSHGFVKPGDKWMHHSMRASKATPYEEAAHIPFLVRFPRRVAADRRTPALFASVDVMPTLLGLCGVKVPKGVQGHDLSYVVTGQDGPPLPDSVYLQNLGVGWPNRSKWVGFWRGVRTDRWMYARWLGDDHEPFLFDLKNDPYEMQNLAGKPKFAKVQEKMEERLKQWMAETGDTFDTGPRDAKGMLKLGQKFANEKWEQQ